MIPIILGASLGGAPGVAFSLLGEAVVSAGSAGIRINIDGTVDSRKGAGPTYAQVDTETDWVIPNSQAASRTFHFKLFITESQMLGDDMNVWVELVDELEWWHVSSGLTRNGTLSVSDDGGTTTLTDGVYSFQVP